MKKLLALFGALTLTSVSASTVVACGDPDDNGGGTTNPPSTEKHNLDDLFTTNEINTLKINMGNNKEEEGRAFTNAEKLFIGTTIEVLDLNYVDNSSPKGQKFKDIGVSETNWSNSLEAMPKTLLENNEQSFMQLIDIINLYDENEVVIDPTTGGSVQTFSNYEVKLNFNYSYLKEANKDKSWYENTEKLIEKVNEGEISVIISELVVTWYDFS
ncbi:lipoprotein [Spiroplasma culicicola]|uniref:Lipoprotein n=1 Tax=Spiroplasma culicicola AES-1 TaxID=1276246 RepID=W6AG36_9MOLU|nr:lipoprotein [Spiroplasma culicicola]AHI52674.1 hypothetical protein SCULI_v1c03330 [Spiroplasma culicicola AES-1]